MADTSADIRSGGTQQMGTRRRRPLNVALGCLCLSAAPALADSPATPAFTSSPTVAGSTSTIPAAFNGLQPLQAGSQNDLLSRLGGDGKTAVAIPLSVQFGQGRGVSFLYNLAAAQTPDGTEIVPHRAASYGFSNALAFSHDALHLTGLMQFGDSKDASGQTQQSQIISQALAFDSKGWKFDAHYQAIGKDNSADTIKAAALKLGLADDKASATAGQLAALLGQKDLGLGLSHTDAHGNLGFVLRQNDNALTHVKTTDQLLSFGRTFGRGLQFDATHDTLSAQPTQNGGQALTTTTNHLKLGLDGGKGMSFSAESNTIGDSQGRAEQHLAYNFADQLKDAHFGTRFLTNSVKNSGGTATDQTLGMDFDRQAKGLGLKGSFLQFAATGTDGTAVTRTTEHLEMALKDTQIAFNLQSNTNRLKDAAAGTGDKALNFDLSRQTKGLSLKASLAQTSSSATDGQAKTTQALEVGWQARKNLTLLGHWNQTGTEATHPQPGQSATRDAQRDLSANLTDIRLRGLKNSQATLNLVQAISQGKAQTDTRALVFNSDMPDTHVHLEYTGSTLGCDTQRNSIVSRAIRIANIAPGDWLRYSAYYKQRSQSQGGCLPDIRDYQVGMRLRHITLGYHYMNQHEEDNATITDTVSTTYEIDGPLTKKLAWNAQYVHSTNRTDSAGLESWLFGVKGDLTPRTTLEMMIGRPELRVDGTTVPGQTFKLTFLCKLDEADAVALNGEVTNWTRKTHDTPNTVTGKFRLDLNKGF